MFRTFFTAREALLKYLNLGEFHGVKIRRSMSDSPSRLTDLYSPCRPTSVRRKPKGESSGSITIPLEPWARPSRLKASQCAAAVVQRKSSFETGDDSGFCHWPVRRGPVVRAWRRRWRAVYRASRVDCAVEFAQ